MSDTTKSSDEIAKELKEAETATMDWLTENLPLQKAQEFLPILGQHLRAMTQFSQDCVMTQLRKRFNVQ